MRSAFPNQHPPSRAESTLALRIGAVGLVATIALALFVVLPGGVLAEQSKDTTTTAALEGALPPLYVPSPGGLTIGVADISDVDDLTAQLGFKVESLASFDTQGQRFISYIPGAPQRINSLARERMRGRLVIFVRRQERDTSGYAPGTVLRLSSQGTAAASAGTSGIAGAPPADAPSSAASSTPAATPVSAIVRAAAGATPAATVTATPASTATPAPSATAAATASATATVASTTIPTAVPKAAVSPARTTPQGCQAVPESRLALLNERVGFGNNTTGGADGCLYVVTTDADGGPGSLRAGAESGNKWIVFERDMTIRLNKNIELGGNLTVDGRGARVEINGAGLHMQEADSSNVILENLIIRHAEGYDWNDLLRVTYGATNFWFDHLTLADAGDEYIDITSAKENGVRGTVSWTRFDRGGPIREMEFAILIGDQNGDATNPLINVTLHHNWYNGTSQRHPLVAAGKVHSFNNLINYREFAIQVRRIGASSGAQLVSEHDVFRTAGGGSHEEAVTIMDGGNAVRIISPLMDGFSKDTSTNAGAAFNPGSMYPYQTHDSSQVAGIVQAGAGWRSIAID